MLQRHAWAPATGDSTVGATAGLYDLTLSRRNGATLEQQWLWQNGSAVDDMWGPSVVIEARRGALPPLRAPWRRLPDRENRAKSRGPAIRCHDPAPRRPPAVPPCAALH